MKRLCLVLLVSCLAVPGALAQEHYTEGPVWACSAIDDATAKGIATKHFKTADEEKQREMIANRFTFRDSLGTSYYREVSLKPMP